MPSFYFNFFIGLLCLFHCKTAIAVPGSELIAPFKSGGTKETVKKLPECILDLSNAAKTGETDNLLKSVTKDFVMRYGDIDFDLQKTRAFLSFMEGKYAVDTERGFDLQKVTISGLDLTAYRVKGNGKFTIGTVQGMPEASDPKYEFENWYLVNKNSKLIYSEGLNLFLNHPSGLSLFVDHLEKEGMVVPEEVSKQLATFKAARGAQ